jgi:hypothetical protein
MTASAMAAMRESATARESKMRETGEPIEMEGSRGKFRIASAGGKAGLEWAFLYEDDKHRFFFYADVESLPDRRYGIHVNYASARRLEGPPPTIPAGDRDAIMENIRLFFTKRNFASINDELIKPEHRPQYIRFSWTFNP